MRTVARVGAAALLMGLAGCVIAPPPLPPQIPLVAVPGPAKTQAAFQQDDTACRAQAAVLPTEPAAPTPGPATNVAGATGQAAPPPPLPPGAIYLRCMASRNNVIEPLATTAPPLYAYYTPYPIYAGFGDTYPWLYGGYGFGFYGGFGGYDRFGFRDYGFRDGGFRDGGFRDGGFRGGYGGRGDFNRR